jgi:hypothetical protein
MNCKAETLDYDLGYISTYPSNLNLSGTAYIRHLVNTMHKACTLPVITHLIIGWSLVPTMTSSATLVSIQSTP